MEHDSNCNVERYSPDCNGGLSAEQVQQRIDSGCTNHYVNNTTKSYGQILKEHFFTFYNILNIVLAGLLLAVGAYKDLTFAVIVVANFTIGIVQEFSSKRTLDKLSLIVAAKVRVIRGGKKETIRVGDIVLDDVMELKTGDQICADSVMLEGYLEVNESLITGESDMVTKREGDFLYSGSFVVSGSACARADHVGEDNYANKISKSAKKSKKRKSELYTTLGFILKIISYILIPLGIMLFYKQNVLLGLIPSEAVVKTVAALIGMIPEGLILMTSIAFVASVIFLAHDNTLVQDMYGIETLARADIVCLDKTGTLTRGELSFGEMMPLADCDCEKIMRNICGASKDENATMAALKAHFAPLRDFTAISEIPFSSERKYSGIYFQDQGAYILGATDFVLPTGHEDIRERAEQMAESGARVLLLARSAAPPDGNSLPPGLEPIAFIILADELRPDVHDTLSYFYEYDVDIKIISGDHPVTVSRIAEEAGVRNAANYVDASTLTTPEQLAGAVERYSVFGRVSPAQKKQMVALMKANGHKVAMMGDGVNDVLALKEADCSVAVASGSDAAKNVSDIVLMDSNLKHLLHVVEDGRKIINNIQRVATLFITKTVYSVLLALATLFLFDSAYPFTPLQLVITSFTTIGAPAFFLALEPQYGRIKGKFIRNVLERSLPGGLAIMLAIVLANVLTSSFGFTAQELSTMCVYIVVAGGMIVLFKVSRPLTTIRKAIIIGMSALFVLGCVFFQNFFEIHALSMGAIIATVALCVVMPLTMLLFEFLTRKMWDIFDTRKPKNKQLEKITEAINKGINKE